MAQSEKWIGIQLDSAIKYLLWDSVPDPRFRTFDDFIAWGKTIGMDFGECGSIYEHIQIIQEQGRQVDISK